MDGRYLLVWGGVHYGIMWAKITYKNLMLQVCWIFVKLALLVLGGGSMCCPNVGAEFRSQYLPHISPIWLKLLLGEGDGCAQLDRMDLEIK
jgi:hypothetical protein